MNIAYDLSLKLVVNIDTNINRKCSSHTNTGICASKLKVNKCDCQPQVVHDVRRVIQQVLGFNIFFEAKYSAVCMIIYAYAVSICNSIKLI